jgi:FMN reductase
VPPLIVGIGGTTRPGSSTERALALALAHAARAGADTKLFGGTFLRGLPMFAPERVARTDEELALVEAVRVADGLLVASPGYHGGVSGLVKNALDLLEDLRDDERPYLDGRAVGCVVTAAGEQAGGSTLGALRSIVHALRGWPTPLGVAITGGGVFTDDGRCVVSSVSAALGVVGEQVTGFAVRGLRLHAPAA